MKPVRGLPALWRGNLPPERRMALAASAALLLLIGGMALYQASLAPNAPGAPPAGEPEAPSAGWPGLQPGGAPGTQPAGEVALPSASGPGGQFAEEPVHQPGSGPGGQFAEEPVPQSGSGPGAQPAGEPALQSGSQPDTEAEPVFSWPLAGRPRVVMAFGAVDGSLGDFRLSDSLALEATPGQPVVAAAAGTVTVVEEHPVDGFVVVVDHGGGRQSRYAGLAEASVAEGQAVAAGERLGRIGLPAPLRRAWGPHLLFALLVDDEPVDPLAYLEE